MANIVKGQIGNALESVAPDGIVATADAIYDETKGKSQEKINEDTKQSLAEQANNIGYYECGTAAATAAKEITGGSYKLPDAAPYGGALKVKFTYKNSAANPTLNINGSPAKPLYYNGSIASSTNTWEDGDVLDLYYDGTNFNAKSFVEKFATGQKVKNVGIDAEPTAGSQNLVKSGGVNNILKEINIYKDLYSNGETIFTKDSIPAGYIISVELEMVTSAGAIRVEDSNGVALKTFAVSGQSAGYKRLFDDYTLPNNYDKITHVSGYSSKVIATIKCYNPTQYSLPTRVTSLENTTESLKDYIGEQGKYVGAQIKVTTTAAYSNVALLFTLPIGTEITSCSPAGIYGGPDASSSSTNVQSISVTGGVTDREFKYIRSSYVGEITLTIKGSMPIVIADNAVTIDKIREKQGEPLSTNICNPAECYFGNDKYINKTTGAIGTYTSDQIGGYTGYIPIDEKGVAVSNTTTAGVVIGGAVYYINSQGNKIFKRSAPSGGIVQYDGGDSSLPDSNPLHYPDAYVRYTLWTGASSDNVMANVGLSHKEYEEYKGFKYVISKNILPSIPSIVNDVLSEKNINTDSLELVLPPKFYCVKGDTLQLFYNGLGKIIGLDNRFVKPTCEIGTPYKRYLEIPATLNPPIGNKSLSITIYDDNMNVLANGTTSIQVVNAPTSPSTEKHILCVGSSTVTNGILVCEAQRRLIASDGTPTGNGLSNIKFVGNNTATVYGQTSKFCAVSGWGWKDFVTGGHYAFRFYLQGTGNIVTQGYKYTNNGHTYTVMEVYTPEGSNVETIKCSTDSASNTPSSYGTLTPISGASYPALTFTSAEEDAANPFWDKINEELDFTSYVNTYCEGSIDIVYTMLGVNKMFDGLSSQEGYVRTFIESLHEEYPTCKIILATDAYPSMELMMPGYGASGDMFSNTYRVKIMMADVYAMYKRIANEYSTRTQDPIDVEFELCAAQVDSDYNFPITEKDVNTRNNSVKEPYANNTIHPGEKGYLQEGDTLYRSIVAHLCQ